MLVSIIIIKLIINLISI